MVSTTVGAAPGPGQRRGHLHRGQRGAGVALAGRHDGVDRLLLGLRPLEVESAPDQRAQVVRAERVEPPQGGPAQQGRIHLEEGVLRGGADEHHQPVLDGGEQHVLLGLGEPVHLVDEEHRPLALLAEAPLGVRHRLADVLHAGGGGRERGQVLGGGVGQDAGQGRLSGAGGAPEDGGDDAVRLGQHAQRGAGRDQVLLAHDLVERAGTESGGQGGLALEAAVRRVAEEGHGGGDGVVVSWSWSLPLAR